MGDDRAGAPPPAVPHLRRGRDRVAPPAAGARHYLLGNARVRPPLTAPQCRAPPAPVGACASTTDSNLRPDQTSGANANNCVRNCQTPNACNPVDIAEMLSCQDGCHCTDAPPPVCTCDLTRQNQCTPAIAGGADPDGWCLSNPAGCDASLGCYWDNAHAASAGGAVTGDWLPDCLMYDLDAAGETATSRVDAVCTGARVVFTGFATSGANGEYRTAGQSSNCPAAPPNTIYKLWGGLDLFLYRTKRAWLIGPDLCSSDSFFARITTDEGADIAQSSLVADGGSPLTINCQPGFEGTCGWRECTDVAVVGGGVPSCLRAATPNNAYGWMRFAWNRAIRLRSATASTHIDQTCAGDFNDDNLVTVIELMEVLAGFGMQSCALRADLVRTQAPITPRLDSQGCS